MLHVSAFSLKLNISCGQTWHNEPNAVIAHTLPLHLRPMYKLTRFVSWYVIDKRTAKLWCKTVWLITQHSNWKNLSFGANRVIFSKEPISNGKLLGMFLLVLHLHCLSCWFFSINKAVQRDSSWTIVFCHNSQYRIHVLQLNNKVPLVFNHFPADARFKHLGSRFFVNLPLPTVHLK